MSKNVIMRVVYNRPEMLKVSIDAELAARSKSKEFIEDYTTLFIVEHGATDKVKELVAEYPLAKEVIFRPQKFGLSKNILEGFKATFSMSEEHVIYIEDDMVPHSTYFEYMAALLNTVSYNEFSVLSAYSLRDGGDANVVRRAHHYAAWAPLISKYFFDNYVEPHANSAFYKNPAQYVALLNEKYKAHWESGIYKYRNTAHHQQAGLINRLVDVALITQGLHVYMPDLMRVQHIGFYGDNRLKVKEIPGSTFDARVMNLKAITSSAEMMYEYTGSKQYKDYNVFSPELDLWDGTIEIL
jgi:hypothetical protein